MSYAISLLLGVLGFIKQKSKFVMISLFLLLWILFGFNTSNADYMIYNLIYDGHYPNHEFGFMLLVNLFSNLGFTYQQFLISISLICYLILFRIINKYTIGTNYVIALYFIFPFMLDVVQIRNFIAMTIILLGIQYLLSDKKRATIKYIVAVLAASSIHYTSLFYLILVFARFKSWKKLLLTFSMISIVGATIAYTNIIPSAMGIIFESDKVTNWFQGRTRFGFLIPIIFQLISFGFVYYSHYKYRKTEQKKENDNNVYPNDRFKNVDVHQNKLLEIVFRINIVLLIAIPFYIFNVSFFRLFRNVLLLNYIVVTNGTLYYFKDKYERFIYKIAFSVYVISLLIYFIIQNNLHTVFIPILKFNSIFN